MDLVMSHLKDLSVNFSLNNEKYIRWFTQYTAQFHVEDTHILDGVKLKESHTGRVIEKMVEIGKSLNIGEHQMNTAFIIALFHDIGRFEQITKYGSFHDATTVNHAELGIQILESEGILDSVPVKEKQVIFSAILYHNLLAIPEEELDHEVLLFAKMIRDADKLDILYLLTNQPSQFIIKSNNGESNGKLNPLVIDSIFACKSVDRTLMKERSRGDHLLMFVSFVFDIYFEHSMQVLREQQVMEKIFSQFQKDEVIEKMELHVMDYIGDGSHS